MTNLAPTLQGQGFASARRPQDPVAPAGPAIAETLIGALSRHSRANQPKSRSESSLKGDALRPFVDRANEIFNESSLAPDRKVKEARNLQRQLAKVHPEHSASFNKILEENFGLGDAVSLDSPQETLISGVNDWIANDPEGQRATALAAMEYSDGAGGITDEGYNVIQREYHQAKADAAELQRIETAEKTGAASDKVSDRYWRTNTRKAGRLLQVSMLPAMDIFNNIRMNGKHELSEEEASFFGLPSGTVNEGNVGVFLEQYRNLLEEAIVQEIDPTGRRQQPTKEWMDEIMSPVDTLIASAKADFGTMKNIVESGRLAETSKMLKALKKRNPALANAINLASVIDGPVQGVLFQEVLGDEGIGDFLRGYSVADVPTEEREAVLESMSAEEKEAVRTQSVEILRSGTTDAVAVRNAISDLFSTTQDSYIGGNTFETLVNRNSGVINKEIKENPDFDQATQKSFLSDLDKTVRAAKNALSGTDGNVSLSVSPQGDVSITIDGQPETQESLKDGVGVPVQTTSESLMTTPEVQLLKKKLSVIKGLANGGKVVNALALIHPAKKPAAQAYGLTLNKSMNPLVDSMEGSSHMVKPTAVATMDAVLKGPFAAMQNSFGAPLTINDAIAKKGTSREKNTPGSRHFHGDAIDISLAGVDDSDKLRLLQSALAAGFQGFGFGKNILHVDLGKRRVWDYKSTGETWGGYSVAELSEMVSNGAIDRPPMSTGGKPGALKTIAASVAEYDEEEDAPAQFFDLEVGGETPVFQSSRSDAPAGPQGVEPAATQEPQGSTASSSVADKLERASRQMLIDTDLNSIKAFDTQAEVEEALSKGEVKQGELIFVEGVAMTVKGEGN